MARPIMLDPRAVGPDETERLRRLGADAGDLSGRGVEAALDLASGLALPHPGAGRTRFLWEALATLGAADLQVARSVEPHLDALAILHEAGLDAPAGSTWGVFAAEGPGVRLRAEVADGGWTLLGTKPWCSLADRLTHALVTAWVDDERRGLFAVALADATVDRAPGPWAARGLTDVVSTPVSFDGTRASPVGGPGWYLERDGFAWGGIGVAAIWYGAAVAVADRVRSVASHRRPDDVALLHLGTIDVALAAARNALREAASRVDAGHAAADAGVALALRTRQAVFDAAETVLRAADHGLGPGPLVAEPDHAARVADLHLYLRQHHAERDLVALGREVADGEEPW
ncbi:acyl-CoA dehydrogenase family protein [Nocardioides hankookensis]|uniref:Acyl-CoA dehydrogenase family protein n=1 Tax=Nocardioides hankookensis TaxID=443157 RepID=A0ABW1LHB4_9ACTN